MSLEQALSAQPPAGGILIVDDEKQISKLLGIVLKGRGYAVATAADAYEGLERYREAPADLVLLDYVIPRREGVPYISGPELIASLREINPSVSVYVMSGYGADEVSHIEGVTGFIGKPFDVPQLCDRIDAAMRARARKAG